MGNLSSMSPAISAASQTAYNPVQTIALLISGAILTRLLLNYYTPGLSSIPGPFLAKFSDLWRFLDACRGQHHHTVSQLHKRHGPVVRIGPNAISLSDPAAIGLVLSLKSNLDKTDSVKPMINSYNGELMPMLISARNSATHARIKRPIAGAYSMSTSLDFEHVVDQNIVKLLARLRTFGPNQRCPIWQWMAFFAFDFILQATFSQDWGFLEAGEDVDGMLRMLDLQFTYIGTMGAMPWLDNLLLKNPLLLMLVNTPNTLVDFASDQVKARLQSSKGSVGHKPDYLSRFIEAQQQYPDTISDLQLTTYAATNVLAASDTTSATLTTIIYHILQHPDVHAKIHAELMDASLSSPVTYAEATRLQYLDATIKEVMRVFPTTGIELERKVGPGGLVLPSGQKLPAGTTVGLNAWPVHRDETAFGEDAETFRPERWLKDSEEPAEDFEERLRHMQRAYLAFGAGPRACLGRHMATLQVYKLIATLFCEFEMQLCYPDRPMKTWSTISVKILDVDICLRERERR